MTRKKNIHILLLLALSVLSCTRTDRYVTIQGYAQGGTYSVKFNLNGASGRIRLRPEQIKADIDSILNDIDFTLSGYNKGSVLSRLNAGDTVEYVPGGILEDIYQRAYEYYEETGGALDVAAGPLFNIWGFGFTTDSLPSPYLVRRTLFTCGMGRLRKDFGSIATDGRMTGRDILKADPEGPSPVLNFNAIAQGYSCDLVASYLYGLGVKDMLVDIGEIYCDGVNPHGKCWRVGVDRPFDGNESPGQSLDGIWESSGGPCGIVTSGNYRKFYIRDGRKYSHTIDPRTGYPVEHNLLSATIVASNATDADAYATYCMVIGLEEAKRFISENGDRLSGYLIYSDRDGNMQEWASEGFNLTEK